MRERPTEFEVFYGHRVEAVLALQKAVENTDTDSGLEALAEQIADDAKWLDGVVKARHLAFAALLSAGGMLIKWGIAVRSAEADADRFLRAARQRVIDISAQLNPGEMSPELEAASSAIRSVDDVSHVAAALEEVRWVPLPLPVIRNNYAPNRGAAGTGAAGQRGVDQPAPVLVVAFTLDGEPLKDGAVIQPNIAHDLGVTVSVASWPTPDATLMLRPATVEIPETFQLPEFNLRPQRSRDAREIRDVGRLILKVPQTLRSRPLEFVYRGTMVTAEGVEVSVHVEGQRRFEVRSYDPKSQPVTGYAEVDVRLLELRRDLLQVPGFSSADIEDFLLVLGEMGRIAQHSLANNAFPGDDWTEARWQRWVRDELRRHPRIGLDLEEHPVAAGGITDLSFHRIRIELKVERESAITLEGAKKFAPQTAQYVAGSDKRLGVLAILDVSPDREPPGSARNSIRLETIPDPRGGQYPIVIGIVIVEGNLGRPSDRSR